MNEMTPRERWLALLNGRQPNRIPTDYWATPELHERLKRDLGCADDDVLWRRLHIDKIRSYSPKWKIEHHPDDPEADPWGFRFVRVDYGAGIYDEFANRPLAHATSVGEIHAYRWPTPDDLDYGVISEALDKDDEYYPIEAGRFEPFLIYAHMRGLEQAYMDLHLNPEIVDAALGHMWDFFHEQHRRIFEAGRGRQDVLYMAEDLGSQTGPLFGLEAYRRFLLANQKKMADLARSYGIHVFYHTDGASYDFLPDLIDEVGIEILNPIQYRCSGMERERLIRDFGDKIVFHGAIENQQIIPFGTAQEVAREVRENYEYFKDSRWICAPCHNMQAITPTENVVELYDTIFELSQGDHL